MHDMIRQSLFRVHALNSAGTDYRTDTGSQGTNQMRKSSLPVRDDVTECEYHRAPTLSEITFGHGATHYRTFPVAECTNPDRTLKVWFVADDGLRYYR